MTPRTLLATIGATALTFALAIGLASAATTPTETTPTTLATTSRVVLENEAQDTQPVPFTLRAVAQHQTLAATLCDQPL